MKVFRKNASLMISSTTILRLSTVLSSVTSLSACILLSSFLSVPVVFSQLKTEGRVHNSAPAPPHSGPAADIDSVTAAIYNYKFDKAFRVADRMIASKPDEPYGYFYKSMIYWEIFRSRGATEGGAEPPDSVSARFQHLIEKSIELSEAKIDADGNDIEGLFYYGGALGYRARYEGMKGNWFSAASDGANSRKYLERVVAMDSTRFDAYLGIGAFDYYASHVPWFLKPISFLFGLNGREDDAMRELKMAVKSGTYARAEAAEFLAVTVYMSKGMWPDALEVLAGLHTEYPLNPGFARNLCIVLYKMNDYPAAVRFADSTLGTYSAGGPDYMFNTGYMRILRAMSNLKLKTNYRSAVTDCGEVISAGQPEFLIPWAYYIRGAIFAEWNLKEEAASDFETVLRMKDFDASRSRAEQALDSLKRR